MRWRRTLILLHRDVGFVAVGLTLVYAVSGFAVNHREDWDYNHSVERVSLEVGTPAQVLRDHNLPADQRQLDPQRLARLQQPLLVQVLGQRIGRQKPPRKAFWRSPVRLSLFFGEADSDVADYLPDQGVVEHQQKRGRYLLRQLNFLHLNEGRSFWTYVADLYAVVLAFMAISGIVVVKGRYGLRGRGGWLMAAGLVLPALAYLLLVP